METLTLDFETYYSKEYSLDVMTTEAYIRDPRFEVILASLKFGDTDPFWLLSERLDQFLRTEVDWSDIALIHHHAHFDGAILNWHYGVRPALFIDTLSMARVIDGPKAGNSLAQLLPRHGFGEKGRFITYAKGKRGKDFTRDEIHDYGDYCCNDTEGTYKLAMKFLPQFSGDELKLIDLTVRLFTEPVFVGDVEKLRGAVASERARKIELLRGINLLCPKCGGDGIDRQKMLALSQVVPSVQGQTLLESTLAVFPTEGRCPVCDGTGVDKKPIGSNEQFANLLRRCGVEPETKTSNTTGEQIYAFAKTDPAMQTLVEDEDEEVRALAEARLAVKSNIIETRAQRFQHCAERGAMPVYISYGAAHTLRWGGGDSMNWQNLSGENTARPEMSVIKASVLAPPGSAVVRTDSGQGEARIVAWNAGQSDLIQSFSEGRDVYSEHAATIFGRPVDRKRVKEDYIPGQLGKVSILGMGFGMGWYKASMELLKGMLGAPPIQFTKGDMDTLAVDPSSFLNSPSKLARVNAMPSRLELTDRLIHCAVTEALVKRYRARYPAIPAYWDTMEHVIGAMITGEEITFGAHGIMHTGKDCIYMPNGMKLNYRGLERSDDGEATYFDGRQRTKIYGGLLTENTTQCLHRIIVAGQMLEISEVCKVALMTHDDVVCVVPEDAAELALKFMTQVMQKAPSWAAGLPLTGEGGIGHTLLEAG